MAYKEYLSASLPQFANAEGTSINLMVVFPHLGDEPVAFTAVPVDPGWEHSEELYARAVNGDFGPVAPYEPPPLTVEDYRAAIQSYVDAKAQEKGYENGFSCATYASSSVEQWKAEADAFIAWRDSVWARAFAMLENPPDPPPSPSGFISDPAFPILVWP